jgi:tRNA 2-selenouridine synthase
VDRLERLVALRGKAVVDGWKEKIALGQMREVVADLLSLHYDPGYETSTGKNFVHYSQAPVVVPESHSLAHMQALAQRMVQG